MPNINAVARKEIIFFLLCSASFVLLPGFLTYHLHIGAAQSVKVALKFLSYLTLFYFYEASLNYCFVLFFGGMIVVLRYQFNSQFQCSCWHFTSISWGSLVAIAITGTWMLNLWRQTFWKLIVYAQLPAQLKERNDAWSSSDECSFSVDTIQTTILYYLVAVYSTQNHSKTLIKYVCNKF